MTRSVFALIFALVLAAPLSAQTNTETVDKTLTMQPGGTLRLKTFSGRVRITGGSGDQVVIHAVRRGKQDRLDDIKLEITQSGNTVEVDANHRLVERRNDNVVETDFDIQVPARTRLDIKTFSAPVTVIGVSREPEDRRLQLGYSRRGVAVGRRQWSRHQHVQRRRPLAPARQREGRHRFQQLQRPLRKRPAGHADQQQPAQLPRRAQRRRLGRLQTENVQRLRLDSTLITLTTEDTENTENPFQQAISR